MSGLSLVYKKVNITLQATSYKRHVMYYSASAAAMRAPTPALCLINAMLALSDAPLVNSATRLRIKGVTLFPPTDCSSASRNAR